MRHHFLAVFLFLSPLRPSHATLAAGLEPQFPWFSPVCHTTQAVFLLQTALNSFIDWMTCYVENNFLWFYVPSILISCQRWVLCICVFLEGHVRARPGFYPRAPAPSSASQGALAPHSSGCPGVSLAPLETSMGAGQSYYADVLTEKTIRYVF